MLVEQVEYYADFHFQAGNQKIENLQKKYCMLLPHVLLFKLAHRNLIFFIGFLPTSIFSWKSQSCQLKSKYCRTTLKAENWRSVGLSLKYMFCYLRQTYLCSSPAHVFLCKSIIHIVPRICSRNYVDQAWNILWRKHQTFF